MNLATLRRKKHFLSEPKEQLKVLNNQSMIGHSTFPTFKEKNESAGVSLRPTSLDVLQVNIGKMCNQVCKHCHVDAGPDRKEKMSLEIINQCIEILKEGNFTTLDITGGAPEMHEHFRYFVKKARSFVKKIIVRSNLTIILSNKKFYDIPAFFKEHRVEVTSSLPHYAKLRTDAQRGKGVFDTSIKALQLLNEQGFGKEDKRLILNLVYNPTGSFLPPGQVELEKEYKKKLLDNFNVSFNNLFAITNMPISRFLEYLMETGNYEAYMHKLLEAYNPSTVENLMCRNTISVGWDGNLYDCDFNQMLDLKINEANHISAFNAYKLLKRKIITSRHCFGCTAGAGSSCGGKVT